MSTDPPPPKANASGALPVAPSASVTGSPPPEGSTATLARDWKLPRLSNDDSVIGGVASGLAAELGVPTPWLRLAFVFLFALGGWGAFVYAFFWAGLQWANSAEVMDVRRERMTPRGRSEKHRRVALILITLGLALARDTLLPVGATIGFSIGFVLVGLGLAWRTSIDGAGEGREGVSGRTRIRQLLGGVALVVGGLSMLLFHSTAQDASTFIIGAAFIGLTGTIVVSGPWVFQVAQDFDTERRARIRSDERAEVAAHLHDSVLQTLSLIQKTDDPTVAANLARRQERELRNWLDPNRASRMGGSIRGQLDQLVTDIEERYGIPVEVVAVGDALIDPPIASLLRATREAAVNAAKHSGTNRVDIFVEIGTSHIELFVRDKGKGFSLEDIDSDRRGVRESIVGRMQRAGGTAEVLSVPGEGTDVELRLPLTTDPNNAGNDSSSNSRRRFRRRESPHTWHTPQK